MKDDLSKVTVRVMTASDLPAARALWKASEGIELAEGDSAEDLSRYLERNPEMSFVALQRGGLVAAVLAGHDGRRGFLYHLAVRGDVRGQGVGRALVERSLEALRSAGLKRALLLVAQDNAEGRAFWAHCGWEALDFAEPRGIDL